jgi:signal transduction histidine kinase
LQLETNDFQAIPLIQECIDFYKESDKTIRGDIQILADVRANLYLSQDERLIATIIRNLISNSIKYTAQGKITVYIFSNQNGSFTIGCKDTGKGMPQSLVNKLLSDHYRGNDIRDDSFKMGYVIIKEIVRLIGGQLHIESQENQGTHVWVAFSNQ